MSLLKKSNFNTRSKKPLLIAVALLLLVPCVAAAAFAVSFNTQDPAAQEQERKDKEKEKEMVEMKVRAGQEFQKMKERSPGDERVREEIARKQDFELEARAIMHTALVQLAKINMDQAIQVATSQQPGKVLLSSLGATGWEAPGKLGKDGKVFYHVIIADETTPGVSMHVWVNAIDGSVMKTEKELPRKQRNPFEN